MSHKIIIILSSIILLVAGAIIFGIWKLGTENQSAEAAATKSGLVGHWTMDSNDTNDNTVYDRSGQNRHGTKSGAGGANNTPQPMVGKIKQGFSFDGTDDAINMSPVPSIGTGDVSLSLWIKEANRVTDEIFFYIGNNATKQSVYFRRGTFENIFEFGVYGVAYPLTPGISPTIVLDNQWHHIVGTKSGNIFSFYLDGILKDVKTITGVSIGINVFSLANYSGLGYMLGNLDDARIYNRALSAQEVADLYNSAKINFTNTATKSSSTPSSSKQLVGHWTMDNTDRSRNLIYDKSGFNNNGTLIGTTTSTGRIKEARTFNGSSDYINIGNPASLNISGPITVSAWAKFSATNNNKPLVARWGTDQSYVLIAGGNGTDNLMAFAIRVSDVNKTAITTKTYNDGLWHHYTGLWDGTRVYLYVDGGSTELIAGDLTSGPIDTPSTNVFLGTYNHAFYVFNGQIDDVRVYNYALSAQDVTNLYNSAKSNFVNTGTKTGLVGHWTMDNTDRSRNLIYDKSGFNNNGTLIGTTTSTGRIKEARTFNGSSDYISAGRPNVFNFGYGDYTASAWVKYSAVQNYGAVLSYWQIDSGWYAGYQMRPHPDGFMHALIGRPFAVSYIDLVSDNSLQDGKWHHLTLVNTGTTLHQLYVDGILNDSSALSSTTVNQTINNFLIGRLIDTASYYFNGQIDDVRIYNRALSAQEVVNLYNSARGNYK